MVGLPREYIRIQPLAHGFRIDIIASPREGVPQQLVTATHQPTQELARRFAEMLAKATGFPIFEGDAQ